MHKTSDDQRITQLNEVSCGSVHVDLSVPIAAIKDVGLKAGTTGDVPYVHGLIGEEPGGVEEQTGDGDTTLILDVGLGYRGPVNLGEK
jgi:hypothetical protein